MMGALSYGRSQLQVMQKLTHQGSLDLCFVIERSVICWLHD
jgi:hypothetical protein